MAQNNQTILANAWIEGSNDFQQRIPDPTQAGVAATLDAIFAPMNNRFYNEFVDVLVNRIGMTYVHQQAFRNPLAAFKKEFMYYGSTVQETFFKWVKAHSYNDASETLLKMQRPEAEVCYHSMNRKDRYAITVNREELRQASAEEFGLNRYIAGIMDIPMNSDEYDEYQIMKELIAFYDHSWGFFKVNTTEPTDEVSAKALLKSIRTYSGKLRFPSSLYNAGVVQDIPVFVNNPGELVLLVTPEVQASLDVDALAVLFHVERAEVQSRIVVIDEFPIPGAYALLTTDEFFQCRDTLYENASFYNPETLGVKYYLHHWGIYSVSPFVPAILFTADESTTTPVITVEPSSLTLSAPSNTIWAGGTLDLSAILSGSVTSNDAGIKTLPNAGKWSIQLFESDASTPIAKNSRTYIDRLGVLHLQKSGIEPGCYVVLTADPVYVNPSGAQPDITVEGNTNQYLMLTVVARPEDQVPTYTVRVVSAAVGTETAVPFERGFATLTAPASGTYQTTLNLDIAPTTSSADYTLRLYNMTSTGWSLVSTVAKPATAISLTQGYTTAAPGSAIGTYYVEIETSVDGSIVATSPSETFTYGRNYATANTAANTAAKGDGYPEEKQQILAE